MQLSGSVLYIVADSKRAHCHVLIVSRWLLLVVVVVAVAGRWLLWWRVTEHLPMRPCAEPGPRLDCCDDKVYCEDKTTFNSLVFNRRDDVMWLGHVTRSFPARGRSPVADNYAVRQWRSIADVLNSCSRSSSVTIHWLAQSSHPSLPTFIHHSFHVSIPQGAPSSVYWAGRRHGGHCCGNVSLLHRRAFWFLKVILFLPVYCAIIPHRMNLI